MTRPIAALAASPKPDLTIVDSICGDLNFEEGGNPIQTNRMYLGTDPVQLNAHGCRLMGLDLEDVPYITLAEQWGAGSAQIFPSDIVRLNEPHAGQTYPSPFGIVKRLTRRVRQDSACSACCAGAATMYKKSNTFRILAVTAAVIAAILLVGFTVGGQIVKLLSGGALISQNGDGIGGMTMDVGFRENPVLPFSRNLCAQCTSIFKTRPCGGSCII